MLNRTAQRAYRQRKEKHIQDLEAQVANMRIKYSELGQCFDELKERTQRAALFVGLLLQEEDGIIEKTIPDSVLKKFGI
jgi:hypothetical protein